MDKEVRARMEDILIRYAGFMEGDVWQFNVLDMLDTEEALAEIDKTYNELGYHKPPKDKPPLLKQNLGFNTVFNMQTQRDSDIKWYEEARDET